MVRGNHNHNLLKRNFKFNISESFVSKFQAIDEFYTKMNDPTLNGAIFMAVCRGKVNDSVHIAFFCLLILTFTSLICWNETI